MIDEDRPATDFVQAKTDAFLNALREFAATEDGMPLDSYVSPSGFALGRKLAYRRRRALQGFLDKNDPVFMEVTKLLGDNWWAPNPNAARNDANWGLMIGHLERFVEEFGHARPTTSYVSPDGYPLGVRLTIARADARRGRISEERILDLMRFADPSKRPWEVFLDELAAFVESNGHARVPSKHTTSTGYRLGSKVSDYHERKKQGLVSAERAAGPEDVHGWEWGSSNAAWDRFTYELDVYIMEFHTADVPTLYVTPSGYRLGQTVSNHRQSYRDNRLSKRRIRELERIRSWSWTRESRSTDILVKELKKYRLRYGNLLVPP
jgi:hypothetical protein